MAKYSSDSDSERSSSKYRRKHTRRSSSIDSSDSSSSYSRRQKYSKSRRKRRSRSKSRDRAGKSYSSKHSGGGSSRDRRRHRRSRSSSEDRQRSSKRSDSREKSTSRSSSSQSNVKVLANDKPSGSLRENFATNDSKIKLSVLDDINNDEFVPKQFVSSAKNKEPKMKKIVIDMNAETIHVPQINSASSTSSSIFHSSVMTDKEAKFDKWVKKLYSLRQRALNESSSYT